MSRIRFGSEIPLQFGDTFVKRCCEHESYCSVDLRIPTFPDSTQNNTEQIQGTERGVDNPERVEWRFWGGQFAMV